MAAYIRSVKGFRPSGKHNGGLIYITNHLKEARIFGAQIPIIYDFVAPYLRNGGDALNLATSQREAFPQEEAQVVFRIYVDMALQTGIVDCNWPVLESPSLVNNILALEDPAAAKSSSLSTLLRIRQTRIPYARSPKPTERLVASGRNLQDTR